MSRKFWIVLVVTGLVSALSCNNDVPRRAYFLEMFEKEDMGDLGEPELNQVLWTFCIGSGGSSRVHKSKPIGRYTEYVEVFTPNNQCKRAVKILTKKFASFGCEAVGEDQMKITCRKYPAGLFSEFE